MSESRPHEQPEIEGGRVKQQTFANVFPPAHMHTAQTASTDLKV